MDKLYIVIYVLGKVTVISDPIPNNNMAICEQYRIEMNQKIDVMFHNQPSPKFEWTMAGKKITRIDFETICETKITRPIIGDKRSQSI